MPQADTFDSEKQYIGTVYAKSLLGAAEKAGNAQQVLDEFDPFVTDVLDKLPKLDATLSSPRVPIPDKVAILDKAFLGKMSKQLLNFLKVVVEHGRFDCIRTINRSARRLYNESQGRVEVELRTADDIGPRLMQSITTDLQAALGRQIDMTATVDPDLIGGMEVRVGDTVFDGSVRNRLERLRASAVDKAAQRIRDALDRFAIND